MSTASTVELHLSTAIGNHPDLPAAIDSGDGGHAAVDWEPIQAEQYGKPGTFIVRGVMAGGEFPNPLILNRADPYIIKHTDGYYYFTGSVPEYDRIVLRRSKTLTGLAAAEETVIWTKHAAGEMGNHIWAPELHFIDGKWYIYFAAGTAEDKWAIRQYVLECGTDNPCTGELLEKGKIIMNFESFTLDATTFELNGIRYLAWAQVDEVSNLYIARMSNPWTIEGEQVRIASPTLEWEQHGHKVNEGPAVLVRNGRVFMTYSASATDDRYCMGLLTASVSSDLLDPASWTKSPEPIFRSHPAACEYGPGHNSFTRDEAGESDILVYHARSYKDVEGEPLYDPNRHARIQRMDWNEDGTPRLGYPGRHAKQAHCVVTVE
ncbi:family 43 glycosylhydrolase [Paenibacillus sp. 2TAB23]|uniref:family 43 glycosylhydrolase n=1 Tax=Paenibacillus sp. 2TAB23 TaxID=3233004 RepID=UPI003F9CFBFA